jgi:hypothetical protein
MITSRLPESGGPRVLVRRTLSGNPSKWQKVWIMIP